MIRYSCRKWHVTIGAAFMLSFVSLAVGSDTYEPQVGQRHPDFTLPNLDGGAPVSLSQFRGRKLLLIQFAAW